MLYQDEGSGDKVVREPQENAKRRTLSTENQQRGKEKVVKPETVLLTNQAGVSSLKR
jgi:hypothetical protein